MSGRLNVFLRSTTTLVVVGAIVLLTLAVFAAGQEAQDSPESWFAKPSLLPKDVFDLPHFDRFRSGGKLDVDAARRDLEELSDTTLPAAQRLFDIFAWQVFVALNSPALPSGDPAPDAKLGSSTNGPLLWEFWQQPSAIFLPNGAKPNWNNAPNHAIDHYKAAWRQTPSLYESKQAFSGPLVDPQGHWVHYLSLVNRREFDYLVENNLYYLEGQAQFSRDKQVRFPENSDDSPGAIEIKLAWKTLTPAEIDTHRFLTRQLPVVPYRPACAAPADSVPPAHKSGNAADNGNTQPTPRQTLGLIGMHIAMRTRSSPQWIWATFEQIDNTRLDLSSGDSAHKLPDQPTLARPDIPERLVSANLLPATNANCNGKPLDDWDESKPLPPVEVLRPVPPPPGTDKVNREAQRFFASKNSIFRFYELNGTQWPKHPGSPAVPGGEQSAPESIIRKMPGEVVPVYLTNATMETYFQKGYQSAGPLEQDNRLTSNALTDSKMVFGTESCVGCHYSAGICIGFKKDPVGNLLHDANGNKIPIFGENTNSGLTGSADFSWLLQLEAKARNPKN